MSYLFPWFVTPCLEAFGYLESRFGFDAPVVEQLGRECYISYRRGDRWVSIVYEPGSPPFVQLFHPTHDYEHVRVPRLKTALPDPWRFADGNESQQRRTLQAQAADLEVVEREFLTAI